jgi:CHAD domain-containing protein
MKKNLLNYYVGNQLNSIEKNLIQYNKGKKPECLHQLRVRIKRIKAIFSFAEDVFKEKHSIAELKPLFNKAGKIRELQIHIHLLELFPNPPKKIIKELKKKEDILSQQFIKNCTRNIKLINNFRKRSSLPDKLPNQKVIIKYFNVEKKSATKKLKEFERDELHKYRTKIKKLMYVYNFLPKKTQKEIEFNKVKVKLQQERLGDWHDNYATITYLSRIKLPLTTSKHVLKLKENEEKQFNTIFTKLNKEQFNNKHTITDSIKKSL